MYLSDATNSIDANSEIENSMEWVWNAKNVKPSAPYLAGKLRIEEQHEVAMYNSARRTTVTPEEFITVENYFKGNPTRGFFGVYFLTPAGTVSAKELALKVALVRCVKGEYELTFKKGEKTATLNVSGSAVLWLVK